MNYFVFLASILFFSSHGWSKIDLPYCYNQKSRRVVFQTPKEVNDFKGACQGRAYYQAPKGFYLIEDSVGADGFDVGKPGAPMHMTLKDGRKLLITHWSNLTKNNHIFVLEPNHKNNRVQRHCHFKNYSDSFKARYDSKTKKLMLLIRRPKDSEGKSFESLWVPCTL